MHSKARHDLRSPIATMFLIGSTAHAFGAEFGGEALARCRDEMRRELARFRAMLRRQGLRLDVSELSRAVSAFGREPASPACGLAVQEACRAVLLELGLLDGPSAGPPDTQPVELEVDGLHALEA
ncbi:MAG: hypothetical protein ACRDKW_18620 [Actinomycetota bacterium]